MMFASRKTIFQINSEGLKPMVMIAETGIVNDSISVLIDKISDDTKQLNTLSLDEINMLRSHMMETIIKCNDELEIIETQPTKNTNILKAAIWNYRKHLAASILSKLDEELRICYATLV